MGIQQGYVLGSPRPQDAIDLFKGEWASDLAVLGVDAGEAGLFADERVTWGIDKLGGVAGATVLELGPLEGGHTHMLAVAGAAKVVAVEAASRAWLRCLITKELLQDQRPSESEVSVLLGGAMAYLRDGSEKVDVGWCSGLLYHLDDPVELVVRLAAKCDRLFIWTHVFDEGPIATRPELVAQFDGQTRRETLDGVDITTHRHLYQAATESDSFCGGDRPDSWWLSRDSLLALLALCGFEDMAIGFDDPTHQNGPSLAIAARRTGSTPSPAELLANRSARIRHAPRDGVKPMPSPSVLAAMAAELEELRQQTADALSRADAAEATIAAVHASRTWKAASALARLIGRG